MTGNNATTSETRTIVMRKERPGAPRYHAEPLQQPFWRNLLPRSVPETVLLALVPLLIFLQLAYLWGVRTPIPLQDDWNFLDKMFRALDRRQVASWVFDSPNGHFMVPAALAYFISWRSFSLDLAALRLLNFPICLAAFLLTASVVNAHIKTRFLRFYLYAGVCFVIFNLCFWEHFAQASGFSAMLSALFGGIGVNYAAKASQLPRPWKTSPFLVALLFLLASTLSLGAGYAAVAAVLVLFAFSLLRKVAVSKKIPRYNLILAGLVCTLGLLAILSHPFFLLRSRVTKAAFHTVLVAGSVGSASLDKGTMLSQNVAFACGLVLIVASLSIAFHFLIKLSSRAQRLPVFAMGLVLFGFCGCIAVAIARAYLPEAEFVNSRYTLYPSIIILGALLYFACSRIFLLMHMWCFAATVYLLGTVREQQMGFYRAGLYQKMRSAITTADSLSEGDLKASLYWRENTKGVRRVIARIRRDELNVFGRSSDRRTGLQ